MKKTLFYVTIIAAMAMMVVSCSKDDDKDTPEKRENFSNQLCQGGTSGTWEGYDQRQEKTLGSWDNISKSYVVMRFDRTSTTASSGTGEIVTFENSYKDKFKEYSEFTWYFEDDMLKITYRHEGWSSVYAEYRTQELVINGNSFRGYWFERTDYRYEFNYTKSSFNDWSKYRQ